MNPPLVLNAMDLNDGSKYILQPGIVVGVPLKDWDEHPGFDNSVSQSNVMTAHLIEMSFSLLVLGSSTVTLRTYLNDLNDEIATCSSDAPGTLVYDTVFSYDIVSSAYVPWVEDDEFLNSYSTIVPVRLMRLP